MVNAGQVKVKEVLFRRRAADLMFVNFYIKTKIWSTRLVGERGQALAETYISVPDG